MESKQTFQPSQNVFEFMRKHKENSTNYSKKIIQIRVLRKVKEETKIPLALLSIVIDFSLSLHKQISFQIIKIKH